MASFSAGTTFTDGVANDVTAAKLGALVNNATPTSGLIQDRTAETVTATNDTLLIGDASDSNALKRITVANFAQTLPTAKITTGTIDTATLGTTTGTAATFTNGTLTTGVIPTGTFGTTTSTAATITTGTLTTGVIPTGTFGTTTSTAATITTGTIPTLVATTLVTTGTGTASAPAIIPTGDTNTGIFFPAADTLAATTQGTERLRIDSSGQVGVGVTPSGWGESEYKAIQVGIGGSISGRVAGGDQDKVNVAANIYHDGTAFKYIASDEATIYQQTGGIHTFSNAPSGTAGSTATFTERLRIDSSGNVGIGTTSVTSGYVLDSRGWIRAQHPSGDCVIAAIAGNTTGVSALYFGDSASDSPGSVEYNHTSNHLYFKTNATERLRIDGANGTLTSQPTYDNTAAGSTVVVTSAGLIRRTSSSLKYKKDIENLDSSIVDNAIDGLRPVWYRTKNPEGDDKSTWSHVGLIAEEVDSVEPRLVRYKTVEVSTNENGERIETQLENPVPEDVDYARLSVVLLSEVKAQRVKIASLEARLEALESK
jgi:hypothetical protein